MSEVKRILNMSPETMKALTASCKDLFNPPLEVAKWIAEQSERDAVYVRDLLLREAPTDGRVH